MRKIKSFLINKNIICYSAKIFYCFYSILFFNSIANAQNCESFANLNIKNSYSSGSFVGENDITWNFTNAKGGQKIEIDNGQAICLNKSNDACLFSDSIATGCTSLSFFYEQENSSNIDATVFINDSIIGYLSSDCEEDFSKQFVADDLNISGEFVIRISQNSAKSGQLTIGQICITPKENNQSQPEPTIKYEPKFGDLIFSEIMFDPSPSVGLPECEYIEIMNRSDKGINLNGLKLIVGTKQIELPDYIIEAQKFALICGKANSNDFPIENLVIVNSLPALNNNGMKLQIVNSSDEQIAIVEYSPTMHESTFKREGGWSIEVINPNNFCSSLDNWASSVSEKGGTPGQKNSIEDLSKNTFFQITSLACISDTSIEIEFNSLINFDNLTTENFRLKSSDIAIKSISKNDDNSKLILSFDNNLLHSHIYNLEILELHNCAEKLVLKNTNLKIALPDSNIEFNNAIINELMYDPAGNMSEWIEIYNKSSRFISLADLIIATANNNGEIKQFANLSNFDEILYPNEYAVFSENCNSDEIPITNCHELKGIPNFPNSEGRILISKRNGTTIDDFAYSDKLHFSGLNSTKGISLERINPNIATNQNSNWTSASESSGFSTPGDQNSQFLDLQEINSHFEILQKVITPNGDGENDNLAIEYSLGESSATIDIDIFSESGYLVRRLCRNEYIGTSGAIFWDATNENGDLVSSGIYIILIKSNNDSETNINQKLTCAIRR